MHTQLPIAGSGEPLHLPQLEAFAAQRHCTPLSVAWRFGLDLVHSGISAKYFATSAFPLPNGPRVHLQVGQQFVEQYYGVLRKQPHLLHRFYTDHSTVTYSEPQVPTQVIGTQRVRARSLARPCASPRLVPSCCGYSRFAANLQQNPSCIQF